LRAEITQSHLPLSGCGAKVTCGLDDRSRNPTSEKEVALCNRDVQTLQNTMSDVKPPEGEEEVGFSNALLEKIDMTEFYIEQEQSGSRD